MDLKKWWFHEGENELMVNENAWWIRRFIHGWLWIDIWMVLELGFDNGWCPGWMMVKNGAEDITRYQPHEPLGYQSQGLRRSALCASGITCEASYHQPLTIYHESPVVLQKDAQLCETAGWYPPPRLENGGLRSRLTTESNLPRGCPGYAQHLGNLWMVQFHI